MTKPQLHAVKDFAQLRDDPRFRAALIYIREQRPTNPQASGDEWKGRFDVLKDLEQLFVVKEEEPKKEPAQRYAWQSNENKV